MNSNHDGFGGSSPQGWGSTNPSSGWGNTGGFENEAQNGFGPGMNSGGGFGGPRSASAVETPAAATPIKFTSAPHTRIIPSLICGVLAVLLCAYLQFSGASSTDSQYPIVAAVAWLLAGIFGIVLLGQYFSQDNRQRTTGVYQIISWKQTLYWVTIIALFVGIIWSAIHIGIWAGKH
ncbi:hypothetical protein [Corynebacterium suicordis]|uniref:Uncharacterized protein n=1 Tax=Corynebacterium suicordis DSM 45110 TaxID=1121369 RepID=A0ABR9ZHE5_9CORY|nr:hypothetical protein [Corynebacterium suicordis]MBF4552846.1 hypothetical protein [Corynebacterium suicordis DSM 45110]MDR6278195.1 hypothetical protein [Corynebacterium suicordis]